MTTQRAALLLSGSIGMGHDALAAACAGALEAREFSTQTLDAMRLLGRRGSSAGEAVFRAMLRVPGLFDAFHFAALRTGSPIARLTDSAASRQVVPRLRAYLDEHPVSLAISVFSTGASAVSKLAGRYPAMTNVVFSTDVTPHRLWVHENVDLYLVTSAAAAAAVLRFQPDARVLVVPAPVRPAFYQAPSQAGARAALGVPPQEPCALLMSGAWGLGPVAAAAEALGRAGVHVLAVAGRNAKLEHRLIAAAARQPRLRPFGFTDRVAELMAAADLVITSSGDTCTEARVVGRPLLLLDVVQGHGRDNLQHELELGDAGVTSAATADVVRGALAALSRAGSAADRPAAGRTVPGAAQSPADFAAAFTAALATVGC